MALSFNGREPVRFGSRECTPKVDSETELRLSSLKTYDSDGDEILASAFPEDKEYVKAFLSNRMTVVEKQMLHAYLIGGEGIVDTVTAELKNNLREAMRTEENND